MRLRSRAQFGDAASPMADATFAAAAGVMAAGGAHNRADLGAAPTVEPPLPAFEEDDVVADDGGLAVWAGGMRSRAST